MVELKFAKEVRVARLVMLAKAGIQKSLKFLDSGSRFLQRPISLRLKLSTACPE